MCLHVWILWCECVSVNECVCRSLDPACTLLASPSSLVLGHSIGRMLDFVLQKGHLGALCWLNQWPDAPRCDVLEGHPSPCWLQGMVLSPQHVIKGKSNVGNPCGIRQKSTLEGNTLLWTSQKHTACMLTLPVPGGCKCGVREDS